MKLLLFTRALVSAPSVRFDAANRPQAAARTLRSERTARLRCVWSRGADGRLACRWLRDDVPTGDSAIPVEAIRRFPIEVPAAEGCLPSPLSRTAGEGVTVGSANGGVRERPLHDTARPNAKQEVRPTPIHPPLRTPTATRVTDFRRSGTMPAPVGTSDDRSAPDQLPREPKGIDHVRHVRPA